MRYSVIGKKTAFLFLVCAVFVFGAAVHGAGRAIRANATPVLHPIYSVETQAPLVSLGINCAWGNEDIPQLLSILEEKNIRATFFLVGDWVDRFPESVKMIHEAGHEIGSHSDTHADMTRLSREGMIREIRDSAAKIEAVVDIKVELFRAPSGAYNSIVVQTIKDEGMYPIQWDADSVDYKNPTTRQMQDRIMKTLRNGSILLFHSGAKNTPDALPVIIQAIQDKGYDFVPVGELIHRGEYRVDFEGRQHPVGRG